MAEPITNVLGIVGMENKGAYDADTYYEKLNVVSYQGSSYCALDSVHNVLPTDTTKWQLIAEKGDKGDTGEEGYTPIKGTDYYTAEDIAELESTLSDDVTSEVTEQLDDLVSATPLAASSVADMTDTTRIYVNTTDGHWYWYDGTNWQDGGTYQATGIAEESITPPLTTMYKTNNILPYSGWITGKVLSITSGVETDFPNGSYHPDYIEIDNTEKYIALHNDTLEYKQLTLYTYDSSKNYLGYKRPNSEIGLVSFDNTVKYIRPAFFTVNTPTLSTDFLFMKFSDSLNLLSYTNNSYIKDIYFNTINTNDIIANNEYEFRLLPYPDYASGQFFKNVKYKSIYEVYTKQIALSGGNHAGIRFAYNPSKIHAGDKLYLDITGTTPGFSNIVLFLTSSSSSNTVNFTNEGNNIYSITLTSEMIETMNESYESGYYPRVFILYRNQVADAIIIRNMKMWINNEFPYLNDYLNKKPKKAMFLGDSITALTGNRGWWTYFNKLLNITEYVNVAVAGSHLKDYEDSIYDGNPVFNGPDDNHNNVLGNQVQKIINNQNEYITPDIIMIAIGTNDGIYATEAQIYNTYCDENRNVIPIENVNRQTSAGAFRYCTEKLKQLYPNALIFWCSPIQAAYNIRQLSQVIIWSTDLERLTKFGSVNFIDTEKCGITGYTETQGENGLYLLDGLHPNANGAKYMGYYNAVKVKEFLNLNK